HAAVSRAGKRHRPFVEAEQLLGQMFASTDIDIARDAVRRLQLSSLFDELTKRPLLARLVRIHPELETMTKGAQPGEKSPRLPVSWSSLEKRRAEYEELVKVKIP